MYIKLYNIYKYTLKIRERDAGPVPFPAYGAGRIADVDIVRHAYITLYKSIR